MSVDTRPYSVRLPYPDLIVRNRDHELRAPLYRDGAIVAPDAASTVSVYDASNTAIVSSATVTVTDSVATYTITAATTAALELEQGWRVEWEFTVSSVALPVSVNDAALVRREVRPVISDVDLIRTRGALDGSSATGATTKTNLQDHIDEAWAQILLRLRQQDRWVNLIMSPSDLRSVHLYLSLSLAFDDLGRGGIDDLYRDEADRYRAMYEAEWSRLSFTYAPDDGEQAEPGRKSAAGAVWLMKRGPRTGWW